MFENLRWDVVECLAEWRKTEGEKVYEYADHALRVVTSAELFNEFVNKYTLRNPLLKPPEVTRAFLLQKVESIFQWLGKIIFSQMKMPVELGHSLHRLMMWKTYNNTVCTEALSEEICNYLGTTVPIQ